MGFFSNMLSATVKVALTPVAVVKDAVNIATDKEPETTKALLSSIEDDLSEAVDDVTGG